MKVFIKYYAILLCIATTLIWFILPSDTAWKMYKKGNFTGAELAFANLDMEQPQKLIYRYNRGCAAYKAGHYRAAIAAFLSVSKETPDREIRYKALYNLGNAYFKQQEYALSAKAFRNALALNPGSDDARYNLKLALRLAARAIEKKEHKQPMVKHAPGTKSDNAGKPHSKKSNYPDQGYEKRQGNKNKKAAPEDEKGSKRLRRNKTGAKTSAVETSGTGHERGKFRVVGPVKNAGLRQTVHEFKMRDITKEEAEMLVNRITEDPSELYKCLQQNYQKVGAGKDW